MKIELLENNEENEYLNSLSLITPSNKQSKEINKAINYYKDYIEGKPVKPAYCLAGVSGCLDKDTFILTDKGIITLEDLILLERENLDFVGFQDFTHDYKVYNGKEFVPIKSIYATNDDIKGYEFTLKSGIKIKTSFNHPFKIINENGEYDWREAQYFKEGDYLTGIGNKSIYNEEIEFNEFYYYLGIFHFNGFFQTNENERIKYYFLRNYNFDYERLKNFLIKNNYGKNFYLFEEGTRPFNLNGSYIKFTYTDKFINDFFNKQFIFKKHDKNKTRKIQYKLLNTKEKRFSFLVGALTNLSFYFYKNFSLQIRFSTKSFINEKEKLFLNILFKEFGINNKIRKVKSKIPFKKDYNYESDLLNVNVSSELLLRLKEINKFNLLNKNYFENKINEFISLREKYLKIEKNLNIVPNVNDYFRLISRKEIYAKPNYISKKLNVSYNKLKELNSFINNKQLDEFIEDYYYYDKIIKIEPIRQKFYDIEVPDGHSFISNSIISHNSGKSTCISHIIKGLNLNPKKVGFCAYTGMATSVLIKKGLPAKTCHKLIYFPREIKDENGKPKIIFLLKEPEDIKEEIDLILIDEMSMIDEKMMNEFESFHIPIIGTGDFFQLKPVAGNMNKYILNPDGFLDEPVRQALESPIIYIANLLRQYIMPKVGNYGEEVRIMKKDSFDIDILNENDQILVGKNKTARDINKLYRKKFLNRHSIYPEVGDTLMCLRNNWGEFIDENNIEVNLVNGLQCIVESIRFYNDNKTFKVDLRPVFFEKTKFKEIIGDSTLFKDPLCKDDYYIKEKYPDIYNNRLNLYLRGIKINKFDFGNVITTYKSQGSEWDSVTYFDEYLNKDIYFNHFYTAVTRARKKLDILL